MAEAEKQEGQKTVVAFIAGLLIGGLLVWVFSSTPEPAATDSNTDNEGSLVDDSEDDMEDDESDVVGSDTNTRPATNGSATTNGSNSQQTGNGSLTVDDQAAGTTVVLDSVTYPSTDGWVVVRDYENGTAGSILGAARYSTDVGLTPDVVTVLRATEAGNTYQVMFYSENGDRMFDLRDDAPVTGGAVTFTAQ
jgi:hypothetical protein